MAKITDTVAAVEALVDASSLQSVLTALELMCIEKADHITTNWQDAATAAPWREAAKRIYALACKTNI